MVEQKPGLVHKEPSLQNRMVERNLSDELLQEYHWDQSQKLTEAVPPIFQYPNIRERKPLQVIPRS